MALNVTSVFQLTRACLPMLEAAAAVGGHGDPARVINIGSVMGHSVNSYDTAFSYSASKAAVARTLSAPLPVCAHVQSAERRLVSATTRPKQGVPRDRGFAPPRSWCECVSFVGFCCLCRFDARAGREADAQAHHGELHRAGVLPLQNDGVPSHG